MDGTVELSNVSRLYPGVSALTDINLSVGSGEWLTVMGPSGSGKTTLLNLIAGLDRPTHGEISVSGIPLAGLGEDERARFRRDRVGFVFQEHHLIPYLTATENVMLAQHFHSTTDEEEARLMLSRVGLQHRLTHLPEALSGGERQRVGIARALINEPALLLGDEITGNLDLATSAAILDLVEELHRERGFTIILVTHDPAVASRGHRTIMMEGGRLRTGSSA